jgi:hypothetical protein
VDSTGATLDFLLSAKQDAAAAKRFLAKALGGANHPAPRVINTDGHAAYPPAVAPLKAQGALAEDCRHRPVPYLNNVLTTAPYQAPVSISAPSGELGARSPAMKRRRGQACWSAVGVKVGLLHCFIVDMFGIEA